jgi:hypothetical protein
MDWIISDEYKLTVGTTDKTLLAYTLCEIEIFIVYIFIVLTSLLVLASSCLMLLSLSYVLHSRQIEL